MQAPLPLLLYADLTLLYRQMVADGVRLPPLRRRKYTQRSLLNLLRQFLETGLQQKLPDAQLYAMTPWHVQYLTPSPVIYSAWSRSEPSRLEVYRALVQLRYGGMYINNASAGIIADKGPRETVSMTFYYSGVNHDWYRRGFRLWRAWQHMITLPEQIRAIEQDLLTRNV